MSYQLKQLFSAEEIRQAVGIKLSGMGLFFASPIMLDVFFNNPHFELWHFLGDGVNTLAVKKLRTGEIRILYDVLSDDAVEFLKESFNPPFIAYNLLSSNPKKENQVSEEEVIVSTEQLLAFSDRRLKHKYDSAKDRNSEINLRSYSAVDAAGLMEFFKAWEQEKINTNDKFRSGIYHDELFIERYAQDPNLFGVCAYINGRIIGYSLGLNDTSPIGPYGKCLRGYHQLGLQLFIERAKEFNHKGFREFNIASINNDFKKQFIPFARTITVYGYEIFRTSSFQTKTPNGYTNMLFSQ